MENSVTSVNVNGIKWMVTPKKENTIQPNIILLDDKNNSPKEKTVNPKPTSSNPTNKNINERKLGNKNWVENIPENERYIPNETVLYLGVDGHSKFGIFKSYGRKEGGIIVHFYKSNQDDFMSREWTVKNKDLELVRFSNSHNMAEEFKFENGLFSKK